jgi:chromosome segregation protein
MCKRRVRTGRELGGVIAETRAVLSAQTPTAIAASKRLRESRETVASLERELSGIRKTLTSLDEAVERRTREVQQVERDFEELGLGPIDSMTDATQILFNRQEVFSTVEETLFTLENSRSQDRVSNLEARVEQLRSLVESEAARLNEAERSVEIAHQADNAVRQVANELLSEQFDTVLPLLKELYRRLRPHADWSEIEIDIAGKLRASLNFTVGEGYNPQFLFSSGQRRAAGLAFLLAVHLSRPWCALNTLMLDDPIQHIDDYRSLNLVEVLSAIRRGGRQVIIAVEDKALADVLCRRLRSSPEQPGVRLNFATDQSGSAEIQSELSVAPSRRRFSISKRLHELFGGLCRSSISNAEGRMGDKKGRNLPPSLRRISGSQRTIEARPRHERRGLTAKKPLSPLPRYLSP